MIKATEVKETGGLILQLPYGNYKIVTTSGQEYIKSEAYSGKFREVEVRDFVSIHNVTTKKVTTHYENNSDPKSIMDVERYNEEIKDILKGAGVYGPDIDFVDLEQEFNYRKFKQAWHKVQKEVVTIGDAIPLEITKIQLDTGNKFITANFCIGGDPTIYTYYRLQACGDIIKRCFKNLGMEFQPKFSYNDTKNKKVWSNAEHSGFRYCVAFGTYIFDDSFEPNRLHNYKGTLEKCREAYNSDKKMIENIIMSKHAIHFQDINKEKIYVFAENIQKNLKDLKQKLDEIKPYAKSYHAMRLARTTVDKMINAVNEIHK